MVVIILVVARRARLLSAGADAELVAEALRQSLAVGLISVVGGRGRTGSFGTATALGSLVLGTETAESLDTLLDSGVAQTVQVKQACGTAAATCGRDIRRRSWCSSRSRSGGSLGVQGRSVAVRSSGVSLAIVRTEIQATIKKSSRLV